MLDRLRKQIEAIERRTRGFAVRTLESTGIPERVVFDQPHNLPSLADLIGQPQAANPVSVARGSPGKPSNDGFGAESVQTQQAVSAPLVNPLANHWQFGASEIDTHLPGGGLAVDAVHDFAPERAVDAPAASAFVLALLTRLPQLAKDNAAILWCQTAFDMGEHGRLYGPGLMAAGLSPGRLVMARLTKHQNMAFVLEEAVRSRAVAAVVGEGPALGFTASRRLVLVAQETGIPCLTVNTGHSMEASAAATRWRIAPAIGPPDTHDPRGPGLHAWSLTLTRARGGAPNCWQVFWNHETHSFNLASPHGDGTVLPDAGTDGRVLALPGSGKSDRFAMSRSAEGRKTG